MERRALLGYIAFAVAALGLALFAYDAFVEGDGDVDYAALLIGVSALVAASAVFRKRNRDHLQ